MPKNNAFYFAAWDDSGFLLGCSHQHKTPGDATACVLSAGGYVVAVQNGVTRALTDKEEQEAQPSMRIVRSSRSLPETVTYQCSGYAVMVRIRLLDRWVWTTGMRCSTYEQAAAHIREGLKIVPFGSAEWNALLEISEPAGPMRARRRRQDLLRRNQGETLIEFVLRSLPYEWDRKAMTNREMGSLSNIAPKRSETSPRTFVDVVLDWINQWEVRALERLYRLRAHIRVGELRRRIRKIRIPRTRV